MKALFCAATGRFAMVELYPVVRIAGMRPANNWQIFSAVMRFPVIESYPVVRTTDERSAYRCSVAG
jgi:hypothetical protein